MGRRHQDDQRNRVAQEAARIMIEQGITDFRLAKEKAADRLGLADSRHLPGNDEIEAAVRDHHRLFGGARQQSQVQRLREMACRAMRLLEQFQPRLVGSVLSGLATEHNDIQLHVFSERAENVELFLQNRGIDYDMAERRYRLHGDEYRQYPVYRIPMGETWVDAAVFGVKDLRQPPRSPVDGQPMRRAVLAEVEQMLEQQPEPLFGLAK